MTNQQKKICPSVITITRVKRLEIEKFFFVPFCYVKRQAKFEDEQIRSSWARDRVEKVLFWGSGNGFSHILLVNVIFVAAFDIDYESSGSHLSNKKKSLSESDLRIGSEGRRSE